MIVVAIVAAVAVVASKFHRADSSSRIKLIPSRKFYPADSIEQSTSRSPECFPSSRFHRGDTVKQGSGGSCRSRCRPAAVVAVVAPVAFPYRVKVDSEIAMFIVENLYVLPR